MLKVTIIGIFTAILILTAIYFSQIDTSNQLNITDVNHNEIWDDIEPFIEKTAKNEAHRKALEQFFKVMQKNLIDPKRCDKIKNKIMLDDLERAATCLRLVNLKYGRPPETPGVEDAIISSISRARAYNEYNSFCSGGFYPVWDTKKEGSPCDFDVE